MKLSQLLQLTELSIDIDISIIVHLLIYLSIGRCFCLVCYCFCHPMHTIYLTLISINKTTKKSSISASAAPPTARIYGALTITQFSSVARAATTTTKAKQTVSVVVIALTTKAGSDADVYVGSAQSTSRHFHSSFSSRYL